MRTLEYGMAYAARGWRVFALSATKKPFANCASCRENHRTPSEMESCSCLTCHGFYAATTDQERIEAMLRRYPHGRLAIRTGAVSGLAVVDVDFRRFDGGRPASDDFGYRTMRDLTAKGLLPPTLTQSTGSGGLHFLYGHPGDRLLSGAGKYGPQVDSKADGGYIVVAPSVSTAGAYTWRGDDIFEQPLTPLPEPMAARVRPSKEQPRQAMAVAPWTRPGVAQRRLEGLVQTVLDASVGERNDTLYWAASKAGEMVAANAVDEGVMAAILADAGRAIGLSHSEIGDACRGTIGAGLRKGKGTS